MSDKFKISVALPAKAKGAVKEIRAAQDLKTDAAAIDDAIRFRARLANYSREELEDALAFMDAIRPYAQNGVVRGWIGNTRFIAIGIR